ncbi:chromosomal replication initiator protein DnaA [Metamycoplasma hominis]
MKTTNPSELDLRTHNMSFQKELVNTASDPLIYDQFLSSLEIVKENNKMIYILVKGPEDVLTYIKNSHNESIKRAIKNVYGEEYNLVYIRNLDEIKSLQDSNNVESPTNSLTNNSKENFSNIKKNLTFDDYAIGKFNNMALKAAKAICNSEKILFSPLFIHASSGLGKTHLLHAIGNELLKHGRSALYINPDSLTRRLVEQLKSKNQEQINKIIDELMSYDCLMFDDVQQYGNRDSTLNVLFNIIDNMIMNDKQIIFCGDKKPDDLGGFEQRFITRFNGGLTVEILKPELNDVINILKFKLQENGINPELWEEESLKFIARNFSSSIRNIEGAINRIKLFQDGDNGFFTYDINTIKSIFNSMTQVAENITPDKIIDAVSKYYKIDRKKILSNVRTNDVVNARRIATYLVNKNFNYTLQEIGKVVGNQSHSNVIVSLNWIEKNANSNPTLKLALQKIESNLKKIS